MPWNLVVLLFRGDGGRPGRGGCGHGAESWGGRDLRGAEGMSV